jgi:hypothetical protein
MTDAPAIFTKPPPLPCSRCSSAVETGDLRCPVCFLALPDNASCETVTRVEVLRCRSCGAAMKYCATSKAPQCAFCGGVLKLEEFIDPDEQIQQRLPFTVDRAHAAQVYQQWIAQQGFFRPFNLASEARLESLRAVWWPAWMVDARARATWTADSDAGAQKAKWAPHAGEAQCDFDDLVIPASRGLTPEECERLVASYDLTRLMAADTDAALDVEVERFDMARSFARATIVGAIQKRTEARIKAGEIPGSRLRNLHTAIHLRGLSTRRVALPAYVIAYRYRGALYRTVISGQDPTCAIGEAPRSIGKLVLVILLGLLALGGLAAVLRLGA